jgi:rare lipoprotein A
MECIYGIFIMRVLIWSLSRFNFLCMKLLFSTFLFVAISITVSAQSGYEETGVGSYYSDALHGRKTASGEVYKMEDLTCAHNTLPFNTMLRVTDLKGGNSVIVRVNDRGPYSHGRIVDLSRAAAEAIGMVKKGSLEVKIQEVKWDEIPVAKTYPMGTVPTPETAQELPSVSARENTINLIASATEQTAKSPNPVVISEHVSAPVYTETISDEPLVTGTEYKKNGTYRIELREPAPQHGYIVQVASLSSLESALKEVARIQQQAPHKALIINEQAKNGNAIYKLAVGPYETKAEANKMKEKLARKGFPKCFITKD